MFDVTTGNLLWTLNNPEPAVSDGFSLAVSISGDYAIVGAPNSNPAGLINAGNAYVYDLTTGDLILTFSGTETNNNLGSGVALSDTRIVVGVPYANEGTVTGQVYVYAV